MRVVLAALALALGGCGSAAVSELPPPARPADAPPPDEPPAGRVVPVGEPVPAAGPANVLGGRAAATVDRRARVLELRDAETGELLDREPAGVGPAHVASDSHERLWVTDTQGDGLLVFRARPELELERRVYLPGDPYGIAVDDERYRLWVTLSARNELAELPAHGRPHLLGTLPTVRAPEAVAVDPATGVIAVRGEDEGAVQLLDPATR